MVSSQAAIFPGQGAQLVGMGADVAEKFTAARDTFAEADQVLGFALSDLCFNGPDDRLNATDIQQPAIFTTSVALFRAAEDAGAIQRGQFAAMGGLSLGEYTALHLAGALAFADALKLVHKRGQLMQQACEAQPSGMVSLLGADEDKALALCEAVASHGVIGPANFNCPGQIVISGAKAACDAAVEAAGDHGVRAVTLPVAGAFHSELMRPAADGLKPVLDATEFAPLNMRVIANVNADYHAAAASIRDSLYRQVFNPVLWQGCVQRMIADGCGEFFEIGPNRHLTGMLKKIDRKLPATNISKLEHIVSE